LADPENRPRAFSLEPNPLSSEAVVHLAPGSGLPDDRRRNLERDPLRAALAYESAASLRGLVDF
jgi:hypothetical protein